MGNKKLIVIIFLLILAISLFIISGCAAPGKQAEDKNAPGSLVPVEVREYQGEKLGSVNDFNENSIKGPQKVNKEGYLLNVIGLVQNPVSYTYDQIVNEYKKYDKVVTLNCVEGWSVKIHWEGLLVKDILAGANPLPGAKVVIFKAYDGYSTSMPLDYIINNNIILAYRMNGVDLPPERGYPLQLVAESKWGYKWIKWVTGIELSDDINYKGFWESRGYSNQGDLDKSFSD
jgi:DMSO/TMAO reductase YedYZ molybdopterin-dependent catalytic subunit